MIAAGGTGGHIYPALSVAKAMKEKDPSINILFVGTPWGLENKMVPREGFNLTHLSIGRLNSNVSKTERIKTLLLLPFAFLKAAALVIKHKPAGLIGMGGQVSGPLLFMASIMGKKTWIWEPNAVPGMANRHLSKFVNEGLIVFEDCLKHMKLKKHQIVGLPIRKEIEDLHDAASVNNEKFNILIFGGSQGSLALNNKIFEFLKDNQNLKDKINIVHQTGERTHQQFLNKYKEIPSYTSWIEVKDYLHDMPSRYQWADLVIARSGTGTLSELAACKKPSILVPLPTAADNHQYKNAKAFSDKQAAILIEEKDVSSKKLKETIDDLLTKTEKLKNIASNTHFFYKKNSAQSISNYLTSMI